jgi:hypothetical protein
MEVFLDEGLSVVENHDDTDEKIIEEENAVSDQEDKNDKALDATTDKNTSDNTHISKSSVTNIETAKQLVQPYNKRNRQNFPLNPG